MRQSQLAMNIVSLRGELLPVLDACAEAGFRNVEFPLGQIRPFIAEKGIDVLQAELAARSLTCIGGFNNGLQVAGDAETNAASEAALVENAQLLYDLAGPGQVQVCGTDGKPLAEIPNGIELYARALARVAEKIEPLGGTLLVEFNWGGVKSMRATLEIARASGAPNVGVLFDPAHFHCTASKSEDLTTENVRYIRHVHVDNMRSLPPELAHCNSDRVLPDDPTGVFHLRELFGRLESAGYRGYFSIEMFSEELWALPPLTAAQRMHQSLLTLCDG